MFFKRKLTLKKESKKASKLVKQLISFKLVRIILIALLFILLFPFVIFFIHRPKPADNIRYGVNYSDKYARDLGLDWKYVYIQILDDLKAKNIRIVAYWDDIEKDKDKYDYSNIIWQIEEAQKRDVDIILTLGRKVPRYPECFEPDWWKELDSKNTKEMELLEYVRNTVEELKKYEAVKIWQVENEPFFPFGVCEKTDKDVLENEIKIVRQYDPTRPILVQDSGEVGFWYPTYALGDYLGISMYRKIWYDFWGLFMGNFIYFQYPLAHWTYKIKADLVGIPMEYIIVTELQAEPWGPVINSLLPQKDKDMTMSRNDFIDTLNYAQKAGFDRMYFWGVEWWYWEKEMNNNSFFWNTSKAIFQ